MLGRMWSRGNPPTLLVEMYIGPATMENRMKVILRKLKLELPCHSAISLLEVYPNKTVIQKYMCTPVFTETHSVAQ